MRKHEIAVAAAVIERPDGSFLLAQRPVGKVYAGYWEFPGGKVEPGEPVASALRRELHEELGVEVISAHPWVTRLYKYPHGTVRLNFFRVVEWRGDPHPHEGQALSWQRLGELAVGPMLPANAPILKALSLPLVCGITHAWQVGATAAISALESATARGLGLLQVREDSLPASQRRAFAAEAVKCMRAAGGLTLINGDLDLAREVEADGVHLPARQLMEARLRPEFAWCGASCHDELELARAADLGVDFVLLGPVMDTPTHPGRPGMGWAQFSALSAGFPVPVFAIGGLSAGNLPDARRHGAHGVAMIRGAWEPQFSSG